MPPPVHVDNLTGNIRRAIQEENKRLAYFFQGSPPLSRKPFNGRIASRLPVHWRKYRPKR